MSLASRQGDRITHDEVGLAGTKRQCLPEGQTPENGTAHTRTQQTL